MWKLAALYRCLLLHGWLYHIEHLFTARIVCLYHAEELCSCPPSKYCLRYRYTLDEIPAMLSRLKDRAECYEIWHKKVEESLDATDENKVGKYDMTGAKCRAWRFYLSATIAIFVAITTVVHVVVCRNRLLTMCGVAPYDCGLSKVCNLQPQMIRHCQHELYWIIVCPDIADGVFIV